jgi:hypothetical protein
VVVRGLDVERNGDGRISFGILNPFKNCQRGGIKLVRPLTLIPLTPSGFDCFDEIELKDPGKLKLPSHYVRRVVSSDDKPGRGVKVIPPE